MNKQYQKAGVDIELGNKVKSKLPQLLSSTNRSEVLGKVGGFGGLFALNTKKYKTPVLVSSVDGVGTKLKIAFEFNQHNTIGLDLVNHCVNDIAVLGAEPLFFLDYIGLGKLDPKIFESIIQGFVKGCRLNNCTLIGGETAQMPGFYKKGEYDVSGTIVGVVEKDEMITGENICEGDVVIGVESSGLHTNGYSLARKILFDKMRYGVEDYVDDIDNVLGDELLQPHISYLSLINKTKKYVNGIAHITGGGFYDNIPRILPSDLSVVIEKKSWNVLPIFDFIQKCGKVSETEMYHVFNMGIGMVFVMNKKYTDKFLKDSKALKYKSHMIGHIEKGDRSVVIK
jgi:phosphoribosylformylglycinamidine cyclo-ligase